MSTFNPTRRSGSCLTGLAMQHAVEATSSCIRVYVLIMVGMRMSKMPRFHFLPATVDDGLVFGCALGIVRIYTLIDRRINGTADCFTSALHRYSVNFQVNE